MAHKRELGLRRGVGRGLLASVVFVNLAMAVFVSLGVVADEALGLTPVAFIIVGIVFLLSMLGYLEGIAMLPQAGGAAGFARRGLGELTSFLAGWALILDYLILVVLTSYFAVHYIGSVPGADALLTGPWDAVAAGLLIIFVALIALRGAKASTIVSVVVALIALVAQMLLAVLGFVLVFEPSTIAATLELGTTPSWNGFLFALPIAMIGFTGLDSVANLSEELQAPGRDLPRPLIWSAVTSVVVFVIMSVIALNAQPVRGSGEIASTPLGAASGWVDRPVIGIIDGFDLSGGLETTLVILFAVLAALVLFLASSTAIAGLGRVAYFMSRHRQAPSALFRVDRATGVPRTAIAMLTIVALALLVTTVSLNDSAVVLAQVYAFGATFTATVAGIAIIRLRHVEPELVRPYRAPFNMRVFGREQSLLVVVGTVGSAAMWMLVMATHDAARVVGLTWLVAGFVGYGTYRLTHGLPLARRVDERIVTAPRIEAQSYQRVLLAVRPEAGLLYGAGDAELVGLANKLLDRDQDGGAQVDIMLVHELPLTVPLDAPLGDEASSTTRRLAQIRNVAASLDLRVSSSVARARAAGRAICLEADRRGVDAVLLATRGKQRRVPDVFGRTISYVLRHAPCDVVVLKIPVASLRRSHAENTSAPTGTTASTTER